MASVQELITRDRAELMRGRTIDRITELQQSALDALAANPDASEGDLRSILMGMSEKAAREERLLDLLDGAIGLLNASIVRSTAKPAMVTA